MSRSKANTRTTGSTRLGDLVKLLNQIQTLYEELLALIGKKIQAMKRADLEAMRTSQASEQELTRRLHEREGLRRQLMDAIGLELGLPAPAGRTLKVSQLAARIGEAERVPLSATVDRLRSTIAKVAQANRVAGVISREIVNHLRWVFAAVQPRGETPAGYSGAGVPVCGPRPRLFEAVG